VPPPQQQLVGLAALAAGAARPQRQQAGCLPANTQQQQQAQVAQLPGATCETVYDAHRGWQMAAGMHMWMLRIELARALILAVASRAACA
jgi:hypothetical protein